ncbi:MAG: hypothetical protein HY866_02365, partial [Chloroflexi bacterium]|nr:hypothetical protein [Chloroflexota bacterium]
ALETGDQTGFTARLSAQLPQVETVSLNPTAPSGEMIHRAHALAESSDVLIVTTRNAHLVPAQMETVRPLVAKGKKVILICLRNPYDAGVLTEAGTVICTCGDSAPSLQAAVDVLVGKITPTAALPVPLTMG